MLNHLQGIYISEFAVLTLSLFITKKGMESTLGELEIQRFCQFRNVVERRKSYYYEQHYYYEQQFRFNLLYSLKEKKKRNVKSKLLLCKDLSFKSLRVHLQRKLQKPVHF